MTNRDAVIASVIEKQVAKAMAETDPKDKKYLEGLIGETGGGESSPRTMSSRDRSDIDFAKKGAGGEAEGVGISKDTLPFLEGMVANMLDEKNEWVAAARDLKMPLKAGISGTTRRWMHTAKQLASPLPPARLVMVAHPGAHQRAQLSRDHDGGEGLRALQGRQLPPDGASEGDRDPEVREGLRLRGHRGPGQAARAEGSAGLVA